MTYSPIFTWFFEERDLIKFAADEYFTPLTFEELIMNQINHAVEFYVHTGNHAKARDISRYGFYIFERISKEQMIEFATNPELGAYIRKRHYKE